MFLKKMFCDAMPENRKIKKYFLKDINAAMGLLCQVWYIRTKFWLSIGGPYHMYVLVGEVNFIDFLRQALLKECIIFLRKHQTKPTA